MPHELGSHRLQYQKAPIFALGLPELLEELLLLHVQSLYLEPHLQHHLQDDKRNTAIVGTYEAKIVKPNEMILHVLKEPAGREPTS